MVSRSTKKTDTMALATIVIGILVVAIVAIKCQPIDIEVLSYLQKYGYLNIDEEESNTQISDTKIQQAIALFQEYYQIPGDGILNNATLSQMRISRCGIEDIPRHMNDKGIKKWKKTHLTWNFYLADQNTLQMTEYAFSLWSANSSLSFERKTLNPDILISYRGGVHKYADKRNYGICSASFDGRGNILAHAFYPSDEPNHVSEIHIDNAEPWYIHLNINPSDKIHLLNTMTHEIGHSLGLQHSSRTDSIMFAYSPVKSYPVKLSIEDILSIQQLYGNKKDVNLQTTTMSTTTTKKGTKNTPEFIDLCNLQYVDTILILDHRIFITYQHYAWSLSMDGKRYEGPFLLKEYMDFFPEKNFSLSAAYQRPSGEIVLFLNNMIYMIEYPSFTLKAGWPKTFADLRFPTNARINAAINTNKGKTYIIFNDNTVMEINECTMSNLHYHSLEQIFPGIPPAITLAFRNIDGNLYFANKQNYYKFNEFTKTLTADKFDLKIINVECPRNGLLRQLQNLLNRLVQTSVLDRGDGRERDENNN